MSDNERDETVGWLDALPRERAPDPALEDRTVMALRTAGLLGAGTVARRPAVSPAAGWWAAGIAAALACFLGGLLAGQQLGSRQAADLVAQLRGDDAAQMAAVVQRTGSAYVSALAALGMLSEGDAGQAADPAALAAGREVALNALWAAAEEVLRFAPDDAIAARIVAAFEAEERRSAPPANGAATRRVVWF
jgi:hypothetical protein